MPKHSRFNYESRYSKEEKGLENRKKSITLEKGASFQTQKEAEIIKAIEKEHSVIQVDETICSNFASEELVSGIQSDLTAGLEMPLYTVSSKVNATIQEKIQLYFFQLSHRCLNMNAKTSFPKDDFLCQSLKWQFLLFREILMCP